MKPTYLDAGKLAWYILKAFRHLGAKKREQRFW